MTQLSATSQDILIKRIASDSIKGAYTSKYALYSINELLIKGEFYKSAYLLSDSIITKNQLAIDSLNILFKTYKVLNDSIYIIKDKNLQNQETYFNDKLKQEKNIGNVKAIKWFSIGGLLAAIITIISTR